MTIEVTLLLDYPSLTILSRQCGHRHPVGDTFKFFISVSKPSIPSCPYVMYPTSRYTIFAICNNNIL